MDSFKFTVIFHVISCRNIKAAKKRKMTIYLLCSSDLDLGFQNKPRSSFFSSNTPRNNFNEAIKLYGANRFNAHTQVEIYVYISVLYDFIKI